MKRLTAHLAGVTAVLFLGALVLAPPAGATAPFMDRQPQGAFTLDACDFPVLIQPTGSDTLNLFFFSDGEILGAGPYVGTATNLETGKAIKINISDSFSVVEHSDGSVTFTFNGTVLSSLFGTLSSGHGVIEVDANGNVTSSTFNGTQEDLCAELAAS